jgi:hypothetical protein
VVKKQLFRQNHLGIQPVLSHTFNMAGFFVPTGLEVTLTSRAGVFVPTSLEVILTSWNNTLPLGLEHF